MSITIFCNQSVTFNHPKDYAVKHTVRNLEFSTVPAWVEDSKMFKMLKKDNAVRVIESSKDLKDVETTGKAEQILNMDTGDDNEGQEDVDAPEDEVDMTKLSAKQLYRKCKEAGIEVEPNQKRAVYLELLQG